jgi:integrase
MFALAAEKDEFTIIIPHNSYLWGITNPDHWSMIHQPHGGPPLTGPRRLVKTEDLSDHAEHVDLAEIYTEEPERTFRTPVGHRDFERTMARVALITDRANTVASYRRWIGAWWALCEARERDLTDAALWRGFILALAQPRLDYLESTAASRGRVRPPRGQEPGIGASALRQAIAAMAALSRAIGRPSPMDDPRSITLVRSVLRRMAQPPQRATALLADGLAAGVATCEVLINDPKHRLRGLRNRAMLLLGWHGALRRSELAAIQGRDLTGSDTAGWTLALRGTKTDASLQGVQRIPLYRSQQYGLDPIAAVQALQAALGDRRGPLFRRISAHGTVGANPIHPREVGRILQDLVGVDGFSAHGLRSGYVTTCRLLGRPDHAVRKVSRHRSPAMLDVYARDIDLDRQGPGDVLGPDVSHL